MNVNQTILNITIPTKLLSWYKQFVNEANKILEQEENNRTSVRKKLQMT